MRVQNEAQRIRPLRKLLSGNRNILHMSKQLLSNEQLEEVIRSIIQPINKQEMRDILKVSVYDVDMYTHFREVSVIMKEFSEYRNWFATYTKQYYTRLVLIASGDAGKYLPNLLDGGSGKPDQKAKGLIQYFLQGLPNRRFATRIWKNVSHKDKIKKKVKTFDDFVEVYEDLIYKLELKVRRDLVDINNTFKDELEDTEPVKPTDYRKNKEEHNKSSSTKSGQNKFSRSRGRFSDKVNAISQEGVRQDPDEELSDDDEREEDEDSDVEPPSKEESGKKIDTISDSKEEEGNLIEEKDIPLDCEWLQGIVMDPDQKRPSPCWKFALTNKCEYGDKCIFSHHPDDVKTYLAAKAMGKNSFNAITKGIASPNYSKPQARPTGSFGLSPGIRPRIPTPMSILKATGNSGVRKI